MIKSFERQKTELEIDVLSSVIFNNTLVRVSLFSHWILEAHEEFLRLVEKIKRSNILFNPKILFRYSLKFTHLTFIPLVNQLVFITFLNNLSLFSTNVIFG